MTRRTMFQRGDVQNKPSGLWGMLKSVTASAPGSESILCLLDSTPPLCIRGGIKSNGELVPSGVPVIFPTLVPNRGSIVSELGRTYQVILSTSQMRK